MSEAYVGLSPDQADAIAGNTRLLTEALTGLAGELMPPGRAGVAYLDGFIGRQRERGDDAQRDRLADMAGCYLGAALVAELGGRWIQDPEHGLGVEVLPDLVAFPFAKAAKHFAHGGSDSVLSFFEVTALIAEEKRRRVADGSGSWLPGPDPVG